MNEQYQYTCVIFLSLILNINVLNGTKPSIIWFMVSFTHRLWSLPLTACFYRLSRARLPLWGPGWRWRQSRYQLWPPLIVRLQFLKSKEANIHTNTANTGNIRDSKIFSHFYPLPKTIICEVYQFIVSAFYTHTTSYGNYIFFFMKFLIEI